MERLYRLSEVAKALGISVSTLRAWANQGKIKTVRTLGGQRRIPESELKRIEEQMKGGQP